MYPSLLLQACCWQTLHAGLLRTATMRFVDLATLMCYGETAAHRIVTVNIIAHRPAVFWTVKKQKVYIALLYTEMVLNRWNPSALVLINMPGIWGCQCTSLISLAPW